MFSSESVVCLRRDFVQSSTLLVLLYLIQYLDALSCFQVQEDPTSDLPKLLLYVCWLVLVETAEMSPRTSKCTLICRPMSCARRLRPLCTRMDAFARTLHTVGHRLHVMRDDCWTRVFTERVRVRRISLASLHLPIPNGNPHRLRTTSIAINPAAAEVFRPTHHPSTVQSVLRVLAFCPPHNPPQNIKLLRDPPHGSREFFSASSQHNP